MVTDLLGTTAAEQRESAISTRVAELEERLGDPTDPANPLGHATLLLADRAAVPFAAGEAALDDVGLAAEYVPEALGGRLTGIDRLVRVMRPVFRRDVGLAMGYGGTTFMAASDVWMTGTPEQQRWVAGLLLSGRKAAIAQHETAHSNDYVRSQVAARRTPDGYVLSGGKQMINNLGRAGAVVLFSRTDPEGGSRSHSVLLLDPAELPPGQAVVVPRRTEVGLRGCQFASVEFHDCPVPGSALLGPEGTGIETALRSFQISRTVVSAMAVAAVDTTLRTAAHAADVRSGHWQQSRPERNRAEAALAGAFVNLLLYDSLAVVATRALHVLPAETSVYSAALKYLLPRVLTETMYDLSTVLGSGLYTQDGTLGIFQKHIRDVPVLSLGHAGSVACQATVVPQLAWLAKHSWFADPEAPEALFQVRGDVPPLDYGPLALACGRDSLTASLCATAERIHGLSPAERALRGYAEQLVRELADLRDRVLALESAGHQAGLFPLMDRYALLLAAAAVLGVWHTARQGGDPFLAEPAWAAAALHAVARRLGSRVADLPAECLTRVRQEVQLRFAAQSSYDLYNTPVPG
ncbi:acyl-CoA dehydrogenase [Streptomyces sp. NPDC051940]|uniref:acyl-CoA dehydrogenase n=1 Tax=Streptomyces sp. NPDC051940 TaxID=3155675 RepID=UPI003431F641